jgi:Holliday junction DNA helicase RuvA
MITKLTGKVTELQEQSLTLIVSGIGFTITVPQVTMFAPGSEAELHIYMHWSAEQGPSLFGFKVAAEKKLFLTLIDCQGIGPKVAMALLGKLGAQAIVEAASQNNLKALSSVSGVGPKKAEQLLLFLRDKVAGLVENGMEFGGGSLTNWHEVSAVLEKLNYSRTEIAQAMQHLTAQFAGKPVGVDELLRHALGYMTQVR